MQGATPIPMCYHAIAFFGASGTGKTTLAHWIEAEFGLPYLKVGARTVARDMGFDSPYDVDAVGQRGAFQTRLLAEKRLKELDLRRFVTDRTYFDELAYSLLHDPQGTVTPEYLRAAVASMSHYDLLVHCPLSAFQSMEEDPDRRSSQDWQYHATHEALILGLLQQHQRSLPPTPQLYLDRADLEWRKRQLRLALTRSGRTS